MHVHRFDTLIRWINSLTKYHFDKAKKNSFESGHQYCATQNNVRRALYSVGQSVRSSVH